MKKLVFFVIILAVLGCERNIPPVIPNNNIIYRRVKRVVDGDTIVLDGNEYVRLVGVNTPEMNYPSGPPELCATEATAFTDSLTDGKDCYLVYNTSVGDSLDRYGRTLAFVHILPDSVCLNVEIVRAGWSMVYDKYPIRPDYKELLHSAESEAEENGRGLWNPAENCSSHRIKW